MHTRIGQNGLTIEFLDSFFLKTEQQAKQNTVLKLKTNNDTLKFGLHLTVRANTTKHEVMHF